MGHDERHLDSIERRTLILYLKENHDRGKCNGHVLFSLQPDRLRSDQGVWGHYPQQANCILHEGCPACGFLHGTIILTVRPLDEKGAWQYKTEKEYLCARGGEEHGFTAAEYKTAQNKGWEKQYPYSIGKKKEYLMPSMAEVHAYERASKYPKSTKYGRQNPITERWNSESQLIV